MRTETITQTTIIQETTAELFEAKMNDALKDVANPKIKFIDSMPFCAYITYEIKQEKAETLEDEYFKEMGTHACCGECPYLEISEDRRIKYHACRYSEFARKVTTPACELYYQRLLNGTFVKEGR